MTAKGLLRDDYCWRQRVREEDRGAGPKVGDNERERRGLREGDLWPATPRRIVEELDRIGQRSQELAGPGRHIGQLQGLDGRTDDVRATGLDGLDNICKTYRIR